MTIQAYTLIGTPLVALLGLWVSGERQWRTHLIGAAVALAMAGIVCATAPSRLWAESPLLLGGAAAWAVSDWRTGFIRNAMTIPLAIALTIFGILDHGWLSTLLALVAVTAILAFWRFMLTGKNIDGSMLPGGGGGDILVGACIAAGLGWSGALSGLIVGLSICAVAAFITVGPSAWKRRLRIRMGPYLAIGVLVGVICPFLPQIG